MLYLLYYVLTILYISPSLLQSAVPHAIILVVGPANDASGVATVAETLAVFRILRALKMVHALQQGCTNTLDYGH